MIRREKLNWDEVDGDSDGVNVNEDIGEEEIGRRFTKLRPERKQRPDTRGDGKRDKPKKQSKFDGANTENFPAF